MAMVTFVTSCLKNKEKKKKRRRRRWMCFFFLCLQCTCCCQRTYAHTLNYWSPSQLSCVFSFIRQTINLSVLDDLFFFVSLFLWYFFSFSLPHPSFNLPLSSFKRLRDNLRAWDAVHFNVAVFDSFQVHLILNQHYFAVSFFSLFSSLHLPLGERVKEMRITSHSPSGDRVSHKTRALMVKKRESKKKATPMRPSQIKGRREEKKVNCSHKRTSHM